MLANLEIGYVVRKGAGQPTGARSVLMRRYRCQNCGNVTRFDVTVSSRTQCFYHYDIAGGCEIEDTIELARVVEEVSCRWCGTGKFVEILEGMDSVESGVDTL
ncbi:MAG: hypothetical protein ACYDHP_03160 [Ferrimicrobium sp.]